MRHMVMPVMVMVMVMLVAMVMVMAMVMTVMVMHGSRGDDGCAARISRYHCDGHLLGPPTSVHASTCNHNIEIALVFEIDIRD